MDRGQSRQNARRHGIADIRRRDRRPEGVVPHGHGRRRREPARYASVPWFRRPLSRNYGIPFLAAAALVVAVLAVFGVEWLWVVLPCATSVMLAALLFDHERRWEAAQQAIEQDAEDRHSRPGMNDPPGTAAGPQDMRPPTTGPLT